MTERFVAVADLDKPQRCHCGLVMERVFLQPPMMSVFNSYQTVAADKDTGKPMLIRNRDEHRAFLKRNGYEEVGNDKSMAPPQEPTERKAKWKGEVVDVEKLKREGWLQEDLV